MAYISELSSFIARSQRYSSAVQQINNPIYKGAPNPANGKFFVVGSIPMACYDVQRNGGRGGSKLYDSEADAIRALIAAGAGVIQGADCRVIDLEEYVAAMPVDDAMKLIAERVANISEMERAASLAV